MKVWGITEDQLREIVTDAGHAYADNVRLENVRTEGKRVKTVSFTLRTFSSRGAGSRRGPQRRTTSGCWHVHRDVMRGIFDVNPDARVLTMLADYRGAADFVRKYPATHAKQCWQGGFSRDRDRECDCPADPTIDARYSIGQELPSAHDYRVSNDAHRVAALADEEIAEWHRFLAAIGKRNAD